MPPKIRQLVSDDGVKTPSGRVGVWDWVVIQIRALVAWCILQLTYVQELLDQIIIGVAEPLTGQMTQYAKDATTFWVKLGTLLLVGYAFYVKRKKAGPEGSDRGGEP